MIVDRRTTQPNDYYGLSNLESIMVRRSAIRGFTLVELVVALGIFLLITAMAVPSLVGTLRSYRALGDARSIAGLAALARMRAAADFTEARLYVNLTNNTYRIDLWNSATGCWQTDGATVACDAPANATVTVPQDHSFSDGDALGFGGVSAPPPGTQTVFGQAPACLNNAGGAIANTACVTFNSRGIPVTPGNPLPGVNNTPTGNDALYLTNNAGQTYAVTLRASGKPSVWIYNAQNASWRQR